MQCFKEFTRLAGVSVFGIGLAGILGYIFKVRGLYDWMFVTAPMAVPTCVAFVLIGLALIALCNRVWRLENRESSCGHFQK